MKNSFMYKWHGVKHNIIGCGVIVACITIPLFFGVLIIIAPYADNILYKNFYKDSKISTISIVDVEEPEYHERIGKYQNSYYTTKFFIFDHTLDEKNEIVLRTEYRHNYDKNFIDKKFNTFRADLKDRIFYYSFGDDVYRYWNYKN